MPAARFLAALALRPRPVRARPGRPAHRVRRREPEGLPRRGGARVRVVRRAPRCASPTPPAPRSRARSRPGAPAQVFISADQDWMDYVAARGLLAPGPRVDAARQRAGARSRPRQHGRGCASRPASRSPRPSATGASRIADPDAVPAGKYAQGRARLARRVEARSKARLAPAENVRAALALVARGEAPLGHRLSHRRPGRAARARRRHLSRVEPSADRLSARRAARRAAPPRGAFAAYLAVARRARDLGAPRLRRALD